MGDNNPLIGPNDIVIAVMGMTGVGKSTFISLFSTEPVDIGHGLEACTATVAVYPAALPSGTKTKFFLVDTPGFDDTYKSDTDILREVAAWLAEAYKQKIKLTGIIYLHRILDVRLGNAGMKNLRMFKALCGDNGLGSVVLATTRWASVTPQEGASREKQLMENPSMWKPMIDKGSKVFRQDGVESGAEIIRYLLDRKRRVTLDIQEDLVDKNLNLNDTAAGKEVTAEIERQRKMFEQKLEDLRKEMAEASAQRDRERQEEIKEYKAELEQKMREARENEQRLQADKEQLRMQMEAEARERQEELLEKLRQSERAAAREEAKLEAMAAQHRTDRELMQARFDLENQKRDTERLQRELDKSKEGGCVVM